MVDLTAETAKILATKSGSPFLFIGSGFSRRYLGLEDWSGLLKRFCSDLRDYDYYVATANGDLPKTAGLIAKDFHDVWWKSEKYAESRNLFKGANKTVDGALKSEISRYLNSVDLEGLQDEGIQKEISSLRNLNVDGIITTNWDFFLEELFPEYRTYIGQEQLLFSNPQAIAEIYKIHGCASDPASLVLTEADYLDFERRNPYLAAKLITLFIEHPIFFLGYSVGDPHIQSIIFSIASCLGSEKLDQFSENLIFVRRAGGKEPNTQKITFSEGGRNVTATVLETDDFCDIYRAIDANKRKIPARILRYCKEQMYELVRSAEPEKKLAVLDIDELDDSNEVEFVVGVGVAKNHTEEQEKLAKDSDKTLSQSGYQGINSSDIFIDFIAEKSKFDPNKLLSLVYPSISKSNTTFVPVFRYLKELGITSDKNLAPSGYPGAIDIVNKQKHRGYRTKSYEAQFEANCIGKSTAQIIDSCTPEKAMLFIPFQAENEVDRDALKAFLIKHSATKFRDPYSAFFKKLGCFYDHLVHGF